MLRTDFQKEIEAYYREVFRKFIEKDIESLDEAFDDEFFLTELSGGLTSKEDLLRAIEEEALVINAENVERIYIDKGDPELKVRGRSRLNISRDGGKRRIRKIQVDFTIRPKELQDEEGPEDIDESTGEDESRIGKWIILDARLSIY